MFLNTFMSVLFSLCPIRLA